MPSSFCVFLYSSVFLLELYIFLCNTAVHITVVMHRKKSFSIFLSPAGMSLRKLSLGRNNLYMMSLIRPSLSLVSDISAGKVNIVKLFLQCGGSMSTRRPYLFKTRERDLQKIQSAFYTFSHLFVQLLLASFH